MQALAEVTDTDLLLRVQALARNERRATAALVAHLAEVENRKLYLGQACASLFVYCTRVLHLSEHAAYNRIEAARAARRFPAVLAGLEEGLVHVTAVRLLAPVLTDENHRQLLAQASHKSKREIEELVARLRPQPDAPSQVRKLPASRPHEAVRTPAAPAAPGASAASGATGRTGDGANAGGLNVLAEAAPAPARGAGQDGASVPPPPPPPPHSQARPQAVTPLAAERYKVQFTVSAAMREKLRHAQELLRHRIPNGDVGQIFELALDLLVRDLEKKKFAAADRQPSNAPRAHGTPRRRAVPNPPQAPQSQSQSQSQSQPQSQAQSPPPRASRYIPASVKRSVWERDRGCCAFVSTGGDRCGERGGLEFDHIRPHADGGGATVANVRLLCRRHNQYEAAQFYGPWQAENVHEPMRRCN